MADHPRELFSPFPAAARTDWRRRMVREMAGAPASDLVTQLEDEVSIEPLYTASNAVAPAAPPGLGDRVRGTRAAGAIRACRVGSTVRVSDPARASAEARIELAGGADLLWLRIEPSVSVAELATLLAGLDLGGKALVIDAGARTAALLPALATRDCTGSPEQPIERTLAVDPLGALAAGGTLGKPVAEVLAALGEARRHPPGWRSVVVSTAGHRTAGATTSDELAAAVATGIAYLRALVEAGMKVDAAALRLCFVLTVGRDLFVEVAKLRAFRRLWSRVVHASGGGPEAAAAALYVTSDVADRTHYGRWVNQLRATAENFAAVVGGADALVLIPFDAASGGGALGRRLARTTQHILAEEAHLGRVADPAGGSWYVEALTDRLARIAWQRVRALEAGGGIAAALSDGSLAERYGCARAARAARVARRMEPWVGVTAFAHLDESLASTEGAPPVVHQPSPTAPFEDLRRAADALAAAGERPSAALIPLGPQAEAQAAVAMARRALAAGGVAAVSETETGARVAVLCGGEGALGAEGEARITALRAAGTRFVLVTAPKARAAFWRQAGADERLGDDCDLLAVLRAVHRALGVEPARGARKYGAPEHGR